MAAVETPTRTVQAIAKFVRVSPRKARLVTDHIRGRSVPEARTILAFTTRAAAVEIEKVLRSAVANAESNPALHWNGDDLVVARGLRGRRPDAEALARPRPRPRRPHPQAHVPHHDSSQPSPRSRKRRAGRLMGQKVHPGGLRVGVIHDWKSNWMVGKKEFAGALHRGHQDPRAHPQEAVARGAVGHPDPQGQAADHDRHLHGAPRHRDRQVRCRGRRAAQRSARDDPEERPHQHQRDQAPRARREARRPVDRRAAAEPRVVPPRDEALAGLGDPLRRRRREGAVLGPPRRLGDEPLRAVLRGPRAAAHDPRRHRLRLRRGSDPDRPHRRQGLDQQGRDHAGGLRRRRRRRRRASATRTRHAAAVA